jgi:hypothetical protein
MNPESRSQADSLGLILPLAVLGLAAWHALPSLAEAWSDDLYARGAPLACGIWLAPQGWLFLKHRKFPATACLTWLALSLLLSVGGAMTGLRVLHHLALATAVPGVGGLRLAGLATTAAAPAWLPATGWFLSHWKSGGLAGWERPAFAASMALVLLGLTRLTHKPSHATPRSNLPNP